MVHYHQIRNYMAVPFNKGRRVGRRGREGVGGELSLSCWLSSLDSLDTILPSDHPCKQVAREVKLSLVRALPLHTYIT